MKKRYLFAAAAAVFLTSCGTETGSEQQETTAAVRSDSADTAEVVYIDVGQGDSSLIMSGGKSVLIDGGERGEGEKVLSVLEEYDIDKLDCVIATHPHSDHIGGIVDILYDMTKDRADLQIEQIISCQLDDSIVPTTKVFTYFLEDIDTLGIDYISLDKTEKIDLGSGQLIITPSPFTDDENLNNESLAAVFNHGDNSFVFTGDAEVEEEELLVENGAFDNLGTVIYQAGHHGSSTASTDILLEKIEPHYAVISCGAGNSYGHPHSAAVERLSEYVYNMFRTDINGTIVFTSDGEDVQYKHEK